MSGEKNELALSGVTDALSNISGGGNIASMGSNFFNLLKSSQLSQSGRLLEGGHLSEKGYILGTIVEGVFGSEKLQQANHAKMQTFLTNLAEKINTNQSEFLSQVIRINDERTQLLASFLKETDNRLKETQSQMNTHMTRVMERFLAPDREISDNDLKALEFFQKLLADFMSSYSEMVRGAQQTSAEVFAANKIDENMITNCIEANKVIMTTLFETIKELGKVQKTFVQELSGAINTIATGIIGSSKPSQEALVSTPDSQRSLPASAANQSSLSAPAPTVSQESMFKPAPNYQDFANNLVAQIPSIVDKPAFTASLANVLQNHAPFRSIAEVRSQRNDALSKIKQAISKSIADVDINQTLSDLSEIINEILPREVSPPQPG